MKKPKKYKYTIKKFTKYNGEAWYEVTYKLWWWYNSATLRYFNRLYGTMWSKYNSVSSAQEAIAKHKQEQIDYVANQVKSVERVKP